jgi:Cu(I)/Ag(I) efflux system protein CusF
MPSPEAGTAGSPAMRPIRTLLLCGALAGAAVPAAAQSTAGEVVALDPAQQRVTVKHGGIRSLDMPPMTLVFRVRDAHLLDGLTPGDRVRFDAAKVDGQYTITALRKGG